ncbi:pirin family protein [Phenylobacterium terrae]|uniref:Pirin family protein n=1 Tax=Phenylobacterium terrae TaxID=2665495 RepID=A0ABW4N2K4_9CAUL
MIEKRPFSELGRFQNDWLNAHYHFSFSNWYDPNRMGWGSLRVWNDDEIAPQTGFPPHPHRDMEIITYVRKGAVTHQDSLGNQGRTEAGDVQVMSAGSGIRHAEYNVEPETTTLFQIWIEPRSSGGEPGWGAKPFPKDDRANAFSVLASGLGDEGALPIRADARVLGATLQAGHELTYEAEPGRHLYLVAATGEVEVGEVTLGPRDGAAIKDEARLSIRARKDAEIVMVDCA